MASAYLEHINRKDEDGNMTDYKFGIVERFDYNYQPAVYVDGDGLKVKKGDDIRSHCIYNTEKNR